MRDKRKRRAAVVALCYLAAAVLWLAVGAVRLAMDGARLPAPRTLALADFDTLSGLWTSPDWEEDRLLISTDADPQMIVRFDGGLPVTRFVFNATWNELAVAPGGIHLYYTTADGQDFTERRRLWATQSADGGWVFDLGGRRVYAIRFDPGSAGGVQWQVGSILLNADKPVSAYFLPDARGWFLLVFVPLLAAAALGEVVALVSPWFARRRLERKWRSEARPGAKGRKPV